MLADNYTKALAALQTQASSALALLPFDAHGRRRELAKRREVRRRLRAAQAVMRELQPECFAIYQIAQKHNLSIPQLDASSLEALLADT